MINKDCKNLEDPVKFSCKIYSSYESCPKECPNYENPIERVTLKERTRFHKILDDSIDKMNSPKNADKVHWRFIKTFNLQKMINIENAELDLAVNNHCTKDYTVIGSAYEDEVMTESFDLINLNLMMVDNLRGNK